MSGNVVIFSSNYSFNISLDGDTQFIAGEGGPKLFTGSTASPTMAAGSYAVSRAYVASNNPDGGFFFSFSTASNIGVAETAAPPTVTPLPSSLVILLIGLITLSAAVMWRRAGVA